MNKKQERERQHEREQAQGNLQEKLQKRDGKSKRERTVTAKTIGENIRRLRIEHGETQVELGEFLGYGPTTIANYESGYRLPDLETFFKIAFHYKAELEDFVTQSSRIVNTRKNDS